jgi:hypothetical protein
MRRIEMRRITMRRITRRPAAAKDRLKSTSREQEEYRDR